LNFYQNAVGEGQKGVCVGVGDVDGEIIAKRKGVCGFGCFV